jgi:F420-dependent oxidoreductase-like protein
MLEFTIMIEGQNGLNWTRWQRIAKTVDALGFVGLYRSDHYTNANPPDMDSLEMWTSLTWLATHTQRIQFGPLVTPLSFREPTMTARMANAVDELSGGRFTLGLGAGWQEREHTNYGYNLLDLKSRFARFEEGLKIITHLLTNDQPLTFDGAYYKLKDAVLLPRPKRKIPILIGGRGEKKTLSFVAKYADEWNALMLPRAKYTELNQKLDELLARNNRKPSDVRRSIMTGCFFGKDEAALKKKLEGRNMDQLRERQFIVGTKNEVVDQLGKFAEAGVQRVMLQWLDLDDMENLGALGEVVKK